MDFYSNIAVASRSFSSHPTLRHELKNVYKNVKFNTSGKSLQGIELYEFLAGADKAILALEKVDKDLLLNVPALKTISKFGVGLDTIDLNALNEFNIALGWTPGVNKRSVAELVIAAAISLLHLSFSSSIETRLGAWEQSRGRQLTGKTVGIIGCGHIGKDAASLFKAFDCKLLICDIIDQQQYLTTIGAKISTLDNLLQESDIITVHLPLDQSTKGILNAAKLRLIRKGSILINFARGGLIDEDEVKQMLLSGHLSGAAFDVFSEEPPVDKELLSHPRFMPTPHIGGSTEEAVLSMGRAAIKGLDETKPAGEYLKLLT